MNDQQTYTTPQVADIINVPLQTLRDWVSYGFLAPEYKPEGQQKKRRRYTWDALQVQLASIVAGLRHSGLTTTYIRKFIGDFKLEKPLASSYLIVYRFEKDSDISITVNFCTDSEATDWLKNRQCRVYQIWKPSASTTEASAIDEKTIEFLIRGMKDK